MLPKKIEPTLTTTTSTVGVLPKEDLIKVNYVDQNGINETIVNQDRIRQFANTPLCAPQSYKKLLRLYKKDSQGNSKSILTSYYTNGTLHQYLECVNTRALGWYTEWHENGQKKLQTYVLAGIADLNEAALSTWSFQGESQVWNEKGQQTALCNYEHGKLCGEYTTYTAEGQIASRSFWKNGTSRRIPLPPYHSIPRQKASHCSLKSFI